MSVVPLRRITAATAIAAELREALLSGVFAPGMSEPALRKELAVLGKSVGPPWGRDQKDAALAALVALQTK